MSADIKLYKPQTVEIETFEEAMSVIASLTEARDKAERRWANLWLAYQEQSAKWVEESAKAIEAFEKAIEAGKHPNTDKDMLEGALFAFEDLTKKVSWSQDAAIEKLRMSLRGGE
jgi:hypothetical protein